MSAVENDIAGLPAPERPSNKPATLHETFAIAEEQVKPVEAAVKKLETGLKLNNTGSVIAGLLILGAIAGGVIEAQAVAKDKSVETVVPMMAKPIADIAAAKERADFFAEEYRKHLAAEEADRAATEKRFDRQDEKLDLALDALKVPMSKRPKREADQP